MNFELIAGESKSFKKTLETVDRYAQSHWPIIVTGETGVGKELIARRIHEKSQRGKGPFIPVNCAALPPGLFESELFGYEKGAFSGAAQSTRGLVRAAQGGTLFLDEIGDLDLALQVKLLRLLESSEIRPVGSTKVEYADVRIVAATNIDLNKAVYCGRFRLDLLERLSVLTVKVPSLKERFEDIPSIAVGMLERMGSQPIEIDWSCLKTYEWPGNVRQLRNLLIRADVLGRKRVTQDIIERLITEEQIRTEASEPDSSNENFSGVTLADIEKQVIVERLRSCHGNRKRAAKELGIAKSTLHEKLRKWKLDGSGQSWPISRDSDSPCLAM